MKRPKLVWLQWQDAVSVDNWTNIDEIEPECHVIETVGWLIAETDEVLTLAPNYDLNSHNVACFIHIPKAWIKETRPLSFTGKPGKRKSGRKK